MIETSESTQTAVCVQRGIPERYTSSVRITTTHPFCQTGWIRGNDLINGHKILCDMNSGTSNQIGGGCLTYLLDKDESVDLRDRWDDLTSTFASWTNANRGRNMARIVNIWLECLGVKPNFHATVRNLRPQRGSSLANHQLSYSTHASYNALSCSNDHVRFVAIVGVTGMIGRDSENAIMSGSMTWFAAAHVDVRPEDKAARIAVQLFETSDRANEFVSRVHVLLPMGDAPRDMIHTPGMQLRLPLEPPWEMMVSGSPRLVVPTIEDAIAHNATTVITLLPSARVPHASVVATLIAAQPSVRQSAQLRCPDVGGGVLIRRVDMPGQASDAVRRAASVECSYTTRAVADDAAAQRLLNHTTFPGLTRDQLMASYCAYHDPQTPAGCPVYTGRVPDGQPACPAVLRTNTPCQRWFQSSGGSVGANASVRMFCDRWPGHPACDCVKWDDVQSSSAPARMGAWAALELHGSPLHCWYAPCRRMNADRFLQQGSAAQDMACPTITCQQLIGAFSRSNDATVDIINSTIGIGRCATESLTRKSDTSNPNADRICSNDVCVQCQDGVTCTCETKDGARTCRAPSVRSVDANAFELAQARMQREKERSDQKKKHDDQLKMIGIIGFVVICTSLLVGLVVGIVFSSRRGQKVVRARILRPHSVFVAKH